eukprot:307636-Prorocentrum_minimum.AAC.3
MDQSGGVVQALVSKPLHHRRVRISPELFAHDCLDASRTNVWMRVARLFGCGAAKHGAYRHH